MFKDLPVTADAILAMEWSDYEPYFKNLQARELSIVFKLVQLARILVYGASL
jgi:hypothetical protein